MISILTVNLPFCGPNSASQHIHSHTLPFNGLFLRTAGARKVEPFWILRKQEMMALTSAEPYADHLHLTPHRWPCQHHIRHFLQARCSSWCPTNNVKTL